MLVEFDRNKIVEQLRAIHPGTFRAVYVRQGETGGAGLHIYRHHGKEIRYSHYKRPVRIGESEWAGPNVLRLDYELAEMMGISEEQLSLDEMVTAILESEDYWHIGSDRPPVQEMPKTKWRKFMDAHGMAVTVIELFLIALILSCAISFFFFRFAFDEFYIAVTNWVMATIDLIKATFGILSILYLLVILGFCLGFVYWVYLIIALIFGFFGIQLPTDKKGLLKYIQSKKKKVNC